MPGFLAVIGVVLLGFNLRIATSEIPPVLPDLALGSFARSLLVTIPVVCFSLAAFAASPIRRMLGEERGLFVMATALLLGIALRPVWSGGSLFAGTVVCGFAVAVMNVLMPTLVRRRFPYHVGAMTAAYTAALSVGAGLAASLTVPLRAVMGGSVQWALAIWALPAAIALCVWLPQLRRPRFSSSRAGMLFAVLRDARAWQVTAYFGLQSLVFNAVFAWLPAIYREKGTDPTTAGAVLGILIAVGIVGNFIAPLLASRLGSQEIVVWGSTCLNIAGLVGILLGPTNMALVWATFLAVGTGASLSIALLMLASPTRDSDYAEGLSTMALGFGYMLSAIGPLTAGLLHAATGGWSLPLFVMIGVSAAQLAVGLRAGAPAIRKA